MALTYCFESHLIPSVLARCRKNDLAVVDTEGNEKAVREAVSRGVWVYGYLNIGALEVYETIKVEELEIPEEEIIIDLETPNETLEFVREAKIIQMSKECNHIIQNGFDIELSDGATHHFSIKEEDQQNLNTLAMMMSGESMLPYHADGEPCIFLSQEDAQKIFSKAIEYKTYVVIKFNSLKTYINALSNIDKIHAITFDTEIPAEY